MKHFYKSEYFHKKNPFAKAFLLYGFTSLKVFFDFEITLSSLVFFAIFAKTELVAFVVELPRSSVYFRILLN